MLSLFIYIYVNGSIKVRILYSLKERKKKSKQLRAKRIILEKWDFFSRCTKCKL